MHDVNGPAPAGYAQLASEEDESSDWETGKNKQTPHKSSRKSSRKRKQTPRYQAGAASQAGARKRTKKTKGGKGAGVPAVPAVPPVPPYYLKPNLPSFADKYPALFAQTQGALTESLQDDIYDATQDHVLCIMDVDNHVNHCLTVAKNLINVICDIRSDNVLEDIRGEIMHHVSVKARASFMCSPYGSCPDPAVIAENMPALNVDPEMSYKDAFQAAYDTTKTDMFFDVVRDNYGEPLLYAIKMWQENHVSENIKKFLLKYAEQLYSKHMPKVEIIF